MYCTVKAKLSKLDRSGLESEEDKICMLFRRKLQTELINPLPCDIAIFCIGYTV